MPEILATEIIYPDSDGQPMAENTLQYEWIVTIKGGIDAQFRDDPDVFVAGDLLWYPVEGHPEICQAPDTLVAFGRPKGYRGSYMQWVEGGVPPHVVFEVLSPGNRAGKMQTKFEFYQRYGVEEYYIYDPDDGDLEGWLRSGTALTKIDNMAGWISPRLKIRFEIVDEELVIFHPDGRRFLTFNELEQERADEEKARKLAEWERDKFAQEREKEALTAEKLRAQLRALGVEPQE
jgi:Uma2 family endonuclease